MTIAYVQKAAIGGGANGNTSSAVDTSGANFIAIHVSSYNGGTAPSVSDSKSNSYTQLTAKGGDVAASRIFYCTNATVGSGHTFTISGSGSYSCGQVAAFSGVKTTSPFDVENGSVSGNANNDVYTGSVTPTEDNELLVAGVSFTQSSTFSIDLGFSITDTVDFGVSINEGGALAYLIQTTAAAKNPLWNGSGTVSYVPVATIATFKAAAVSGVPTITAASAENITATSADYRVTLDFA